MGHVMIHNTRGKDDVERASLAFLVGNTALSSGQEATLLLTIEGVWVATKGYTEGLQAQSFAPLSELVQQFASQGSTDTQLLNAGLHFAASSRPNPDADE